MWMVVEKGFLAEGEVKERGRIGEGAVMRKGSRCE